MGLGLTEAAIDEFYCLIGDISSELGHINKTLGIVAIALDRIAKAQEHSTGTKKGGEA